MESIVKYIWLVPLFPLVAAGLSALLPRARRRAAAGLAIAAIAFSCLFSLAAFWATLPAPAHALRATLNFRWFDFGDTSVRLGFILDPLTAIMLVMVTFVSLLIFITASATWRRTRISPASSVSWPSSPPPCLA